MLFLKKTWKWRRFKRLFFVFVQSIRRNLIRIIQNYRYLYCRWFKVTFLSPNVGGHLQPFPKRSQKNHPQKVTNSRNCQVFICFPTKSEFWTSPKSPMPKTRFAMPRHKHLPNLLRHFGEQLQREKNTAKFILFGMFVSKKKKGCPFTTKKENNQKGWHQSQEE